MCLPVWAFTSLINDKSALFAFAGSFAFRYDIVASSFASRLVVVPCVRVMLFTTFITPWVASAGVWTVIVKGADTLGAKLLSPEYDAVMSCVPVGRDAVRLAVPPDNVTVDSRFVPSTLNWIVPVADDGTTVAEKVNGFSGIVLLDDTVIVVVVGGRGAVTVNVLVAEYVPSVGATLWTEF